jgi:UDP-N-acetylmuramoyl-tripeptide--D-alanyl-D-alanine ligase
MNLLFNKFHFTFNSKEVKNGSVFIALRTGIRDGNDFAEDAFKNGASFLILNRNPNFAIDESQYLVVKDSLSYITELAIKKFASLKEKGVKTISLTGSVGKTTTKNFIIYLLKKAGKKVFGTEGNLNNHIGVPLTILNSPLDIEFLVLEMGMNNPMEISHLIEIAPTDTRIITNISPAHIGNFKEGLYGIFKAKTEILEKSTKESLLITVPNLPFESELERKFNGNICFVRRLEDFEIRRGKTFFTFANQSFFVNKIATKEWVANLLIGMELLIYHGISLPQTIEDFKLPKGRGDETLLQENCLLINESYNASPEAMKNAINTFALNEGKKLAIIGSMRELGDFTQVEHEKIYNLLSDLKQIDVIFVGKEFEFIKGTHFENVDALIREFDVKTAVNYNFILVKASNSVNLEKFCNYLTFHFK